MVNMIHHQDAIVRNGARIPEFNEYPKIMTHPAFTLGEPAQEVKHPGGRIEFVGGSAVRFPPVTVNTPDDEEWYAAKGYVSQGKSDSKAFAQAVAAAAAAKTPNGYVPQEFPKWAGGVLVNDAEEEAAALLKRRAQLGLAADKPADEPIEAAPDIAPKSTDQSEIAALKVQIAAMGDQIQKLLLTALAKNPVIPEVQPALTRQQKAALTRKARAAEKAA